MIRTHAVFITIIKIGCVNVASAYALVYFQHKLIF